MNSNPKLSYAIAAVLGGSAMGFSVHDAHAAAAAADTSDEGIQEITVTAQRRAENAQNVPITIQALGADQLKELSIANFDDAVKYLPNVSFATNGPGQGNIFMRGLSPGSAGNQSQSSIASFPNVAVYLDDQSVQFPGRNLDINAVDMERIEVLEGPQGTLFGGGAEAGAVRYITNKPKLNVISGSADASYGITAGGDPNSAVNAVLNLPLIQDHLAVRAVIYTDHRGGYIDNVPSNFTRANSDNGTFRFGIKPVAGVCPNGLPPGPASIGGDCVPLGLPVTNNLAVAKDNQNPVDYTGIRVSGLYQFNDDWSLLVTQAYQNMEADGVFTQFPVGSDGQKLAPLQVTAFTPSYDKDKFTNTSWTINGKLGVLNGVYTGGYLIRTTQQENDYTSYARGSEGDYYQCTGGPGTVVSTGPLKCYTAATGWNDWTRNTHETHELRVSTPDDWRIRGLVGGFYENFKIQDDMNFNYKSIPACDPTNLTVALAGGAGCVGDVGPLPGSTASHPDTRGDVTAFGEDLQRGYKQYAFFGSADFDIIPKVLTVTGGTRWYEYKEYETGSEYYTTTSCANVPSPCRAGKNLDALGLQKNYHGFKSRGNITWHVTEDILAYYTYSQGYRPGGFNRESGLSLVASGPDIDPVTGKNIKQLYKPSNYAPDTLTNNEIGVKSEWLNHRLQVNLSGYHMKWAGIQVPLFNPNALGNTTFLTNGADYTINGVELQFVAKVMQGLTLQGSGSYNDAKQSNNPCLIANNPAAPNVGQCITQVVNPAGVLSPLLSVFGPQGGTPAFSPKLQYNARARYDWNFNDYKPFVGVGANHVGSMYNQIDNGTTNYVGNPFTTLLRYYQPGYTTYDASAGIAKDNWTLEAYGTNLGNSDASTFTSSAQFIKSEVPLRPRVLGVKIGFKF